ncbi:unnamed protein product [Arabis nemorensis]|uniref:KIB1-4 beta-propeller domain-containing protein n=1 Tax=Arabis nemorensis TaxID=586526 RepID=A0A565AZQ8_9BRAS|nr:unnamed protein product [Arabis nemorensis]
MSQLFESPSGESFIVNRFVERIYTDEIPVIKLRTFVVFRQDPEQRISSYTEDIGDLCIFLGCNEAFCVSATKYPGLKPNSIYFANSYTGFGFYDLSSNTLHEFINPPPFPCCYDWLAPLH